MKWEQQKLGDVLKIERGGSPRPIDKYLTNSADGINWIKISDATASDRYIFKTKEKISRDGLHKTRIVYEDDFLLSNSMSFGRPYIVKTIGCIHDGWLVLRQDKDKIFDNDFLYHLLSSPLVFKQFNSLAAGSTVRNLNISLVSSVVVPVPSLLEQQQIVEKLDTAFDLIDRAKANIEKNIQNAKELFQSKLNQVFSEKGEEWEVKKLADIFDVRDGTHDSPKYQETGYALITSKNLKNGILTQDNIKFISKEDYLNINKRSKVDKGDILFAMIGTIGNPVVIHDEPDFAIKNVALIKGNTANHSYFYQYFLDSKLVINKMQKESKGATQKFVSLGYLRNFLVPNPKLDEQKKIVSKLDLFSSQTKLLEQKYQTKLANLEELKKSILEKAFKGDLI